MAKNNLIKKHREKVVETDFDDDFDFSELMDSSYDDEMMAGVMSGLIEASNNQMTLAIELTKLAVEKNPAQSMHEDEVFSIFKKASGVINDNFPLKKMLETFSRND